MGVLEVGEVGLEQWREVGTCTTREGAQMRAQNSPAPHRWPSCPQLPQGLAFPGGVVRGAGLEEAGWGPGWVAELCLSTLAGPAATAGPLLFQQRRLP